MVLPLLLLEAMLLTSVSDVSTSVIRIYVDPDNGTMDPKCWTGGLNLPCKDYNLAKEGELHLKVNVQIIMPSKAETCQQTWMYDLNNTCQCGPDIFGAISCNAKTNKVSILNCYCMTHDDIDGVLVGACPYRCGFSNDTSYWSGQMYHPLPMNVSKINNVMCGKLNRDGRLCSKCKEGFSPLVYSYDLNCIRCTKSKYNWLKFTAAAFIPLTIFYFIVIVFRISATNPYLYGFITLNQALASPIFLRGCFLTLKGRYKLAGRLLAIPYTIWNLDYFRSLPLNICLDLSMLQTLALDYAIAVYPLVLVIITYTLIELHARGCTLVVWLWRPFHRCSAQFTRIMDIQSSIIKAFATFFLLSYVKLLNTTIDILLPVKLYSVSGEVVGVYVYYDVSYKYFSKEHLPYAVMGIVFSLVFVFSPILLLLLYPMSCFQKCLSSFGLRSHILHTFVDTFQGYYKDGTEPETRDCRWFAAIYFLGRIVVFYIILGISKDVMCFALTAVSLTFLGVLMILLQPYKSRKVNTYHTILPLIMAVACLSVTILDQAETKARWIIQKELPFIVIFCLSPTLVAIAFVTYYISYRCSKKCRGVWPMFHLKKKILRNLNLMTERNNEEKHQLSTTYKNYQAINATEIVH